MLHWDEEPGKSARKLLSFPHHSMCWHPITHTGDLCTVDRSSNDRPFRLARWADSILLRMNHGKLLVFVFMIVLYLFSCSYYTSYCKIILQRPMIIWKICVNISKLILKLNYLFCRNCMSPCQRTLQRTYNRWFERVLFGSRCNRVQLQRRVFNDWFYIVNLPRRWLLVRKYSIMRRWVRNEIIPEVK